MLFQHDAAHLIDFRIGIVDEFEMGDPPKNIATHQDVLRIVGRPAEISRVHLNNYEVWSYRYIEAGVWNSMMHVHFDEAGIVRLMQNGPDPMYDDRRFFR